jgi:adenine-specific DNA-methyltransferase
MEKIERRTPDLTDELVDRLAELMPDIVTEDLDAEGNVVRSIDFDTLRENLTGSVVDGRRERYQFTWPGKAKARLEARTPTAKTMRPCPEKSVDWDTTQNLYVEGDNLEALKIMRETYAGKVKLIYIDPPYNTGHDFIYDDDFGQSGAEYAASSGDYDAEGGRLVPNPESNGRFHSDWCSMMYPRLLLARDLLSPDGAIFISIDDGEAANLQKVCEEVFGAQCFVGNISWQRTYSPRNDSLGIPVEVEHLMVYSKAPGWNPNRLPRTEDMDGRYDVPDGDPVPWSSGDAAAPGAATHHGMVYAIQHPITGKLLYPSNGRCWTFGQPQMLEIMNEWAPYKLETIDDVERRSEICGCRPEEMERDVKAILLVNPTEETFAEATAVYERGNWPRLYFTSKGRGGIRCKRYLNAVEGKLPTNLWPYSEVGHSDEAKKGLKKLFGGTAPFDTPKPIRLMDRILTIASDKDCIILDFFSGSASMGEAVMRKNAEDGGKRRFILVQLPEEAPGGFETLCDVGEERLRRVRTDMSSSDGGQLSLGHSAVPDLGFRVLRVGDSVLRDVHADPASTGQATLLDLIDNMEEGATPLDLLFQVLPKFRIPYSCAIEEREVDGRTVLDVNGGQLLACFDEDVSTATIEAIAKARPLYAVFRDASFSDDSAVANLEELFKTFSPDTIRRVI